MARGVEADDVRERDICLDFTCRHVLDICRSGCRDRQREASRRTQSGPRPDGHWRCGEMHQSGTTGGAKHDEHHGRGRNNSLQPANPFLARQLRAAQSAAMPNAMGFNCEAP